MIPIEISFPLKTTMSSRMRTIWPMTAVNPSRARAALVPNLIPDAGSDELEAVRSATDNPTGEELEFTFF
jgi:hypothetical protein